MQRCLRRGHGLRRLPHSSYLGQIVSFRRVSNRILNPGFRFFGSSVRVRGWFAAHFRNGIVVLSPISIVFLMYYVQNKILAVKPGRIYLSWEEWITMRA